MHTELCEFIIKLSRVPPHPKMGVRRPVVFDRLDGMERVA